MAVVSGNNLCSSWERFADHDKRLVINPVPLTWITSIFQAELGILSIPKKLRKKHNPGCILQQNLSNLRGIKMGQPAAREGDLVFGVEVHNVQLIMPPVNPVVPMPLPFLGKITAKVSKNVTVNGKALAMKKSGGDFKSLIKVPLLPAKYVKQPKEKFKIGKASKKVKVNGKGAASIGATIKSENQPSGGAPPMVKAGSANVFIA